MNSVLVVCAHSKAMWTQNPAFTDATQTLRFFLYIYNIIIIATLHGCSRELYVLIYATSYHYESIKSELLLTLAVN